MDYNESGEGWVARNPTSLLKLFLVPCQLSPAQCCAKSKR